MDEPSYSGIGVVASADIAVPDHEHEVRFYSRVLSTGAKPLWRREDLMNNMGIPIIGLGERIEEYAHLPLQWMPHIQVADVAQSARKALELGGKELMHARTDDGSSQWAVLQDPDGAAFGIIPVVDTGALPEEWQGILTGATEPAGRIAWLDLTVAEATMSRDFYSKVVGWAVGEVGMKDGDDRYADYNMLGEGGTPVAGVCHARGMNAGLPPVWLIYLPVGDLTESLKRAEHEGGRIHRVVRDDKGEYAYAIVQDPVGVYFALAPG